jgi:hypothetical protein
MLIVQSAIAKTDSGFGQNMLIVVTHADLMASFLQAPAYQEVVWRQRGLTAPQEDFMEDYDDGSGQAHQEDLLRQQEIEEDLGLFSPVYVLSSQQLTAEIFYFKSMEVI